MNSHRRKTERRERDAGETTGWELGRTGMWRSMCISQKVSSCSPCPSAPLFVDDSGRIDNVEGTLEALVDRDFELRVDLAYGSRHPQLSCLTSLLFSSIRFPSPPYQPSTMHPSECSLSKTSSLLDSTLPLVTNSTPLDK